MPLSLPLAGADFLSVVAIRFRDNEKTMLCHGLEIKFVHFGLFKIFGKGNPFAYGLQEALWCVDDCGRLRTSNVLPLTVFLSADVLRRG